MNPAILIGGAAALLLVSGKKRSRRRSITCPTLSPGAGHLAGYDYIEFATGGASLDDSLPIIFFFHCRGCNPTELANQLSGLSVRARVVMPSAEAASNPKWFELKARSEDQQGLAAEMGAEAKGMVRFIEEANQCLGGVGAPVITGHSQGGMLALAVAAAAPALVKAAVVASGWIPTPLWPQALPPTTLIHGMNDHTVDYARTADFVARASDAGLPISLIPIQGQGHGLGGDLKTSWVNLVDSSIRS